MVSFQQQLRWNPSLSKRTIRVDHKVSKSTQRGAMVGSFSGQYYYSRQRQLFPGCKLRYNWTTQPQGMLFFPLNVVSVLWSSWSFKSGCFYNLQKNQLVWTFLSRNGRPEYLETWKNKEDLDVLESRRMQPNNLRCHFAVKTSLVAPADPLVLIHFLFIYAPPLQVIQYIDVICPGLNACDQSVADETSKYLHD